MPGEQRAHLRHDVNLDAVNVLRLLRVLAADEPRGPLLTRLIQLAEYAEHVASCEGQERLPEFAGRLGDE